MLEHRRMMQIFSNIYSLLILGLRDNSCFFIEINDIELKQIIPIRLSPKAILSSGYGRQNIVDNQKILIRISYVFSRNIQDHSGTMWPHLCVNRFINFMLHME